MARLPYVAPGASPVVDSLYERIAGLGRPVLNLYSVLANQPPALKAFLGMSAYVRDGSSLDPGLRELTILATAHALGQEYEVSHHREAARRAGVAAAKVAALGPGGSLDDLSDVERCAVEFARQVAATRTCTDETFGRLQSMFTPGEIVDLVTTTGWYHLCATILGSLKVDLEDSGL